MGTIVKKEVVDGLVLERPAVGDDMEKHPEVLSDYQRFRGKCKELSLALIKENPTWIPRPSWRSDSDLINPRHLQHLLIKLMSS